jgi:hypothetical protein
MDLLSVLEHELGHAAGLDHADDGVMAQTLTAGTRTTSVLDTTGNPAVPSVHDSFLDAIDGWAFASAAFGAAPAPTIDWSGNFAAPVVSAAPAAAKTPKWQDDFVNHLARTEAQRNPNAALRVQVDLAPKLSAALRPLQPTV